MKTESKIISSKIINIKDLLNFLLPYKVSGNSVYISFIDKKSFDSKCNDINTFTEHNKIKHKLTSIFCNIKLEHSAKEKLNDFTKFFDFDDKNYGKYNNSKYPFTYSSGDREYVNVDLAWDYNRFNGAYLIVDNFQDLTKENLLENIEFFVTKWNSYRKLDNNSEIKDFKELFYWKLNNKLFNQYIDELENENKLLVERTPKGIIKKIEINSFENEDLSDNYKNFLKLKSNGKLKDNTAPHINYSNKKLPFNEQKFNLELYKLNLLSHLKTHIIFDNDKWFIEVDYFVLKYAKSIMQDLKGGTWTTFKNNLNDTLKDKLEIIEDYLEIEITNKEELFPLKYMNNESGNTLFRSKEIKFKLK